MLASESSIPPEPDQAGAVIYVGQDKAGHWLVQDSGKRMERCFISLAAAMSYAHGERDLDHGTVEVSSTPLLPLISHGSVAAHERALAHAA